MGNIKLPDEKYIDNKWSEDYEYKRCANRIVRDTGTCRF